MIARMLVTCAALFGSVAGNLAWADCKELTSGPIEYHVTSCSTVDPESLFETPDARDRFYKEFAPAAAKDLLASYKGLLLEGKVTASRAVARGAKTRKKALLGESRSMFVGPPMKQGCNELLNRDISGTVVENCCDGHLEVPCLTKTSLVLKPGKLSLTPRPR